MYSEFLKGTGAPENSQSYEQFLKLEQIYMDCEHISKEQIYRIWKSTYGKENRLLKRERDRRIKRLAMSNEEYLMLPEHDQRQISNELHNLFWDAYYNIDHSQCKISKENKCFIDRYGIVWFLKRKAACRFQYGLFAYSDGQVVNANYYEN